MREAALVTGAGNGIGRAIAQAYVAGSAIVVDGGLSLMNWFDPPVLEV